MKHKHILLASTVLLSQVYLFAGKNNVIKGNGILTQIEKKTAPFSSIQVPEGFALYISQGEEYVVKVQVDENTSSFLNINTLNNTLGVDFGKDTEIKGLKKPEIHVTAPNLDKITSTGSGAIESKTMLNYAGSLLLETKGNGAVKLHINASKLDIKAKGSGDFTIEGKIEKFIYNHSGSGNLTLTGSGDYLEIISEGSGKAVATAFEAQTVKVQAKGSGYHQLHVEKSLWLLKNGSSDITYKGRGIIEYIDAKGSGTIKKI
jgi:hypothetical protein